MKMFLPAILPLALLAQTASAELIFSEYVEGSSNNKALEVTNVGSVVEDLTLFQVEAYHNGRSINEPPTFTILFESATSLAPGDSYVFANSRAFDETLALADQETGSISFNGDDTLVLRSLLDNSVVDSMGQEGVDPGSEWTGGGISAKDSTLRRVAFPDTDPSNAFDPSAQWAAFPQNDVSDLGVFAGDGTGTDTDTSTNTDTGSDTGSDTGTDTDTGTGFSCGVPATLISSIQGSGSASPLTNQVGVEIEAVVVATFFGANELGGYFIQEEDFDADSNPATSEGLYVFDSTPVSVGDKVRLKGTVKEFFDLTELADVTEIEVCASGVALPTPAQASLPLTSADELEAYEGMLIEFSQTLTVNENFNLGRFGQLTLSYGRRFQPTEIAMPGADAQLVADANALNAITLDDGSSSQNPDPLVIPAPELSAFNTVRSGDTITGLTGVVYYSFGNYMIEPVGPVTFDPTNPRPMAPELTGTGNLTVASFNVLNFFNGDGNGSGWDDPNNRGADNVEEYERQLAKLVSAFVAMDADIVGLMEIENDGFSSNSAIADLVEAINMMLSEEDQYDFVNPGTFGIGTDAIAVGMIYRPSVVTLTGLTAILDSSNSPLDNQGEPLFNDNKNRAVLTQSFTHIETDNSFTIAVNHFKSKGSNCDSLGDPDLGDFQGNCNLTRTTAAQALNQWLSTYPTGVEDEDIMVIGDLNAYTMEDPIREFTDNGWVNLKEEGEYSYIFFGQSGNLDHALATESIAAQVISVDDWHINTDEPRVLDYNLEFKSDAQDISYYNADPYRSSDHDPVVVELSLETENQAPVADFEVYDLWFWKLFVDSSTDDSAIVKREWTLGTLKLESFFLIISNRALKRAGVKEATLTVTDDEGLQSSVTKALF